MTRRSLAGLPLALGLALLPSLAVADDGDPPQADPKLVTAAYRKWTYASCEHPSSCGSDLARRAGIRVYDPYMTNPRDNTPNPDPSWLPGWNQLPTGQQSSNATDALVALHLAASRRTWLAACDARYPMVKKALDERDAASRKAIAEANALSTYERIPALLGLPTRAKQGAKPFTAGNDGAAFETEAAIVAAFKAIGREDVYSSLDLGRGRQDVLPRWTAPFEHDAFCRYALEHGDPTADGEAALPALPTYYDTTRAASATRPVITTARLKELDTEKTARGAAAKVALATTKPAEGAVLLGSPGDVKSFKRDGAKAIITLVHHSDYNVGAKYCVNGYGLRVNCPTTRVIEDTTTTITFPEWPADLKLAKGDKFTMFGREGARTKTGSNTRVKWTVAVEGLFLIEVTQAGKPRSFVRAGEGAD